jgi:hypothetical protein
MEVIMQLETLQGLSPLLRLPIQIAFRGLCGLVASLFTQERIKERAKTQ